jgi:hypothetical protein
MAAFIKKVYIVIGENTDLLSVHPFYFSFSGTQLPNWTKSLTDGRAFVNAESRRDSPAAAQFGGAMPSSQRSEGKLRWRNSSMMGCKAEWRGLPCPSMKSGAEAARSAETR